jgi:DNA invertase Pin-like site-specific DNA recombinase
MPRIKYQEALGLEVKRGRPAKGNKPLKKEIIKLYVKESKSIREVAKELRCTKDMVARALIEYGIERKEMKRISKLSEYSLDILRKAVEEVGYLEAALRFGVGKTTLYSYLIRRKEDKE